MCRRSSNDCRKVAHEHLLLMQSMAIYSKHRQFDEYILRTDSTRRHTIAPFNVEGDAGKVAPSRPAEWAAQAACMEHHESLAYHHAQLARFSHRAVVLLSSSAALCSNSAFLLPRTSVVRSLLPSSYVERIHHTCWEQGVSNCLSARVLLHRIRTNDKNILHGSQE